MHQMRPVVDDVSGTDRPVWHFAVTLILVSVLITWMQDGASGSLLPAFICHAMIGLCGEILPLWTVNGAGDVDSRPWLLANGLLLISIAVIARPRAGVGPRVSPHGSKRRG